MNAKRFNDKPALGGDPRQGCPREEHSILYGECWNNASEGQRQEWARAILDGLRESYQRAPVKLQGLVLEVLREGREEI